MLLGETRALFCVDFTETGRVDCRLRVGRRFAQKSGGRGSYSWDVPGSLPQSRILPLSRGSRMWDRLQQLSGTF